MKLQWKLLPGRRKRRPRPCAEVELVDPDRDFSEIIYWASRGEDLRIVIPLSRLRTWGAFGFGCGWNPMFPALEGDFEKFSAFFRLFEPRDLSEMYFLSEVYGPAGISPTEVPWLVRHVPSLARNAPPVQERRFFGPSSLKTIEEQFRRTRQVMQSIREKGYRPHWYGDIQGYFLRFDGDYRFVVKGGKHRASALAHLGFDSAPVRFRPGWPRAIDADGSHEWPAVRRGTMSEDYAMAVMRRFFEFDGTQQRDCIFGATGAASLQNAG